MENQQHLQHHLPTTTVQPRLHHLDAVRAFALLLGIVFHACLSFSSVYIGWAVMDISTTSHILSFITVSHSFRMELFFLVAGFFSHMTFHKGGLAAFAKSRFVRIVIPFIMGWFLLRPLLISGWIMGGESMRGEVHILAGLKGGFLSLKSLPTDIFTGTHLWFLYYMILATVLTVVLRQVIVRNEAVYKAIAKAVDAGVSALAKSRISLPLLALPTAGLIWNMSIWGMDTPDKTLVPHLPALLVYVGFFLFGWMLHRQGDLISNFARVSVLNVVLLSMSVGGTLYLSKFQFQPSHDQYQLAHVGYVYSYALMMWSLVCITIGTFQKLCSQPNKWVRYVADSSYWLYLVHLPIVIWLQIAFAELPMHWSLKLGSISILTIVLSLLMYDLFVRSTFIGKILNGREREREIFRLRSSSLKTRIQADLAS